ncbi:g11880 [Coccomyxa elongata]
MDFNDWYNRYVEAPAPPSPLRLPLQETQPALAPAPPSPPPPAPSSPTLPAQIRAVAPPPPHVMLAPGLSVSQDASPVMGYLMVRAVLPQEKGDRVRVAYVELVWSVTRTLPPAAQQHRPAQPALPVEGPGLALAYIRWTDIDAGVQWNVNGCTDEPVQIMNPVFVERIKAIKMACEKLEDECRKQPSCVSSGFCMRVRVPPFSNSYVVTLLLENQRLRINNSARPVALT